MLGESPESIRTRDTGTLSLSGRRLPTAMWRTESVSRGNCLLDSHLLRFLDALDSLEVRLNGLGDKSKITVHCHINDYGKGHAIYCSPVLVKRLATMNASLEIVVHDGVNDPEPPHKDALDLGFLPDED